MRNILGLVAVVGLASGLVGGFTVSQLSGEAGAAPPCPPKCETPSPTPSPPQPREAEVTLLATFGSTVGVPEGWQVALGIVGINSLLYPPGTVFHLEVGGVESGSSAHCFRLVEVVDAFAGPAAYAPVAGSETCSTENPQGYHFVLESPPFALQSDQHVYTWQFRQAGGGEPASLGTVRVIAEWTE